MAWAARLNHGLAEVLNSKRIIHKYVVKYQEFQENRITTNQCSCLFPTAVCELSVLPELLFKKEDLRVIFSNFFAPVV